MRTAEDNRKENRRMKRSMQLLLFTMMIILFSGSIFALTVTPSRKTFDYKPEIAGSFSVLNMDYESYDISLSAEGDIAEYIELSNKKLTFNTDDFSKDVTFRISLPSDIKAGTHTAKIIVTPIADQEGTVSAIASIAVQIIVNVPYPGKYAEASIDVRQSDSKENAEFFVVLKNKGDMMIENAITNLEVYDENSNLITSMSASSGMIQSKDSQEMKMIWKYPEIGSYKAKAYVVYDNIETDAEKNFTIGDSFVSINYMTIGKFKLKDSAKLSLDLKNMASKSLDDVYYSLIISEQDKELVNAVSYKSKLSGKTTETFDLYFETDSLMEKEYFGKIIIHYDSQEIIKDITARVKKDRLIITLDGRSYTSFIAPIKEQPQELPQTTIPLETKLSSIIPPDLLFLLMMLFGTLLLIFLINVNLLVYNIRKRKRAKEQETKGTRKDKKGNKDRKDKKEKKKDDRGPNDDEENIIRDTKKKISEIIDRIRQKRDNNENNNNIMKQKKEKDDGLVQKPVNLPTKDNIISSISSKGRSMIRSIKTIRFPAISMPFGKRLLSGKIKDFIKEEKEKGVPDEVIYKILRDMDYKEEDIRKLLNPESKTSHIDSKESIDYNIGKRKKIAKLKKKLSKKAKTYKK